MGLIITIAAIYSLGAIVWAAIAITTIIRRKAE